MRKLFIICASIVLLFSSVVFVGCGEKIYNHTIFLTCWNIRLGKVEGSGIYKTYNTVTIKATSYNEEANPFICWLKNGAIVSTEANYTFTASIGSEGKYTAIFKEDNLELFTFDNFTVADSNLSDTKKIKAIKLSIGMSPDFLREVYNEEFDVAEGDSTTTELKKSIMAEDADELDEQEAQNTDESTEANESESTPITYIFSKTSNIYLSLNITYQLANGDGTALIFQEKSNYFIYYSNDENNVSTLTYRPEENQFYGLVSESNLSITLECKSLGAESSTSNPENE